MVNKTDPRLLLCVLRFSEVDREKQNKDADKLILVVKKHLRKRIMRGHSLTRVVRETLSEEVTFELRLQS